MVDQRLKGLTPLEIAELRIKCCEILIPWASRNAVDRGEVFQHAEKVWQFMLQGLGHDTEAETQSRPAKKSSQSAKAA
jgi:hypothetical protein